MVLFDAHRHDIAVRIENVVDLLVDGARWEICDK
jgi:hypothetical protein